MQHWQPVRLVRPFYDWTKGRPVARRAALQKKKPRSRRGLAVWRVWRVQEDIEHAISVRPFYDGLRAAQWPDERACRLVQKQKLRVVNR
jgi:hypothetical protein